MNFPWLLSFAVGFLSLSQEILWVRLISFAHMGAPTAFGFVLTLYLVGIALGAEIGKRACKRGTDLYDVAALALLLAALTDPLPPILGPVIALRVGSGVGLVQMLVPSLAIVATAAIKSVLFPIAHHLGSSQAGAHIGSSVSKVYFGNILGSTLGPIVMGFFLLDRVGLDVAFRLVGLGSLLLAGACALRSERRRRGTVIGVAAGVLALVLWLGQQPSHVIRSGDRSFQGAEGAQAEIRQVVENKYGIIHTVGIPGRTDDVVYGGNAYDGAISIGLHPDPNGIARVYVAGVLARQPRRALVIGLAGGAWVRVLTALPTLERVDVVEINKGYVDLIQSYPLVKPILDDARVAIHVDDGRRWLKRHPGERYDLVLMNTTMHWRAFQTNLLSAEFMSELRGHMNADGVFALNVTNSLDAAFTVEAAFPGALRHGSFLYARRGGSPVVGGDQVQAALRSMTLDGRPLFAAADWEPGGSAHRIVDLVAGLSPVSVLLAREGGRGRMITDANLLPEYRHGIRLELPPVSWLLPAREQAKFTH